MNSLKNVWSMYERQLATAPALTKMLVAGPMFAFTDSIVQKIEGAEALDLRRTGTHMLFGCYYGVVHAHMIWGALERAFSALRFPSPLVGAFSRVIVDQFITGTPLFNSVFFYSSGRLAKGYNHEQAIDHVQLRLYPMLLNHWAFWIPFHTLNFWLVPFRHRVLPAQAALFFWSGFMSYVGAKKEAFS